MARHAHPSSHGRLILRSLIDAPSTPDQSDVQQRAPIDAALAGPLPTAQATRKVHPGQAGPVPLGGVPVWSDAPRSPSAVPHVAHVGHSERSVKPPRTSTPREPGGRVGGNVRPQR
jgi:hypothetical protein